MSDFITWILGWVLGLIVVACFVLIGLLIYLAIIDAKSPTFELRKADWHCTVSRQQMSTMVISTGKTTTVVPRTVTVCDQWSRR